MGLGDATKLPKISGHAQPCTWRPTAVSQPSPSCPHSSTMDGQQNINFVKISRVPPNSNNYFRHRKSVGDGHFVEKFLCLFDKCFPLMFFCCCPFQPSICLPTTLRGVHQRRGPRAVDSSFSEPLRFDVFSIFCPTPNFNMFSCFSLTL